MTLPSRVLRAAKAFAAAAGDDGYFNEDVERLDVKGRFDDATLHEWQSLHDECPSQGIADVTVSDEFGEAADIRALATERETHYRIIVRKPHTESTFYFFDGASIKALLHSTQYYFARRVLIADESFEPFSTRTCGFEHWSARVADEASAPDIISVNPQRFVRAINLSEVPSSVGNFLLNAWPTTTSPAFNEWCKVAIAALRRSLVNEVWMQSGEERVVLFGPRKRDVPAGEIPQDVRPLLTSATKAAEWVYDSGRDREARHAMFTYELAREWPGDKSWCDAFALLSASALDAAKRAYRMQIGETSKETWSALNDIRKGLADEIGQIMQQSRDLSAAMWRDLAVAAGAIIARLAVAFTEHDKTSEVSIRAFMFGTAVYLAYSLYVSACSNAKFNEVWKKNTTVWRGRLYAFLSESDIEELAERPTAEAFHVYRWVLLRVTGAYVIAFAALLWLGFAGTLVPSVASASKKHVQSARSLHAHPKITSVPTKLSK